MLATRLAAAQTRGKTFWAPSSGNPILTATQTYDKVAIEEPSVIYESGTWKLWYTGIGGGAAVTNYATCTGDPTVAANWTKSASNPLVATWASGNCVVHVGSTYYMYSQSAQTGGNLQVRTSTDGVTWGAASTALSATAVSFIQNWTNSAVWNEGGTTWKMLVTGAAGTNPYQTAYATSTDGLSWTVQGTGPITMTGLGWDTFGGAWIANGGTKINGLYHAWFHVGPSNAPNASVIARASSPDAQTWTMTSQMEIAPSQPFEQSADPCVVEVNGVSYLFYSEFNNDTFVGQISVATWPGPLSNLVMWNGR